MSLPPSSSAAASSSRILDLSSSASSLSSSAAAPRTTFIPLYRHPLPPAASITTASPASPPLTRPPPPSAAATIERINALLPRVSSPLVSSMRAAHSAYDQLLRATASPPRAAAAAAAAHTAGSPADTAIYSYDSDDDDDSSLNSIESSYLEASDSDDDLDPTPVEWSRYGTGAGATSPPASRLPPPREAFTRVHTFSSGSESHSNSTSRRSSLSHSRPSHTATDDEARDASVSYSAVNPAFRYQTYAERRARLGRDDAKGDGGDESFAFSSASASSSDDESFLAPHASSSLNGRPARGSDASDDGSGSHGVFTTVQPIDSHFMRRTLALEPIPSRPATPPAALPAQAQRIAPRTRSTANDATASGSPSSLSSTSNLLPPPSIASFAAAAASSSSPPPNLTPAASPPSTPSGAPRAISNLRGFQARVPPVLTGASLPIARQVQARAAASAAAAAGMTPTSPATTTKAAKPFSPISPNVSFADEVASPGSTGVPLWTSPGSAATTNGLDASRVLSPLSVTSFASPPSSIAPVDEIRSPDSAAADSPLSPFALGSPIHVRDPRAGSSGASGTGMLPRERPSQLPVRDDAAVRRNSAILTEAWTNEGSVPETNEEEEEEDDDVAKTEPNTGHEQSTSSPSPSSSPPPIVAPAQAGTGGRRSASPPSRGPETGSLSSASPALPSSRPLLLHQSASTPMMSASGNGNGNGHANAYTPVSSSLAAPQRKFSSSVSFGTRSRSATLSASPAVGGLSSYSHASGGGVNGHVGVGLAGFESPMSPMMLRSPSLTRQWSLDSSGAPITRRGSTLPGSAQPPPTHGRERSGTISSPHPLVERTGSGNFLTAGVGGERDPPRLAQNILLQLDELLAASLPTDAAEQVVSLRAGMRVLQDLLVARADEEESGTDVEVLCALARIQGSFDVRAVAAFRRAAVRARHDAYEFMAWSMPQYLSEAPLPRPSQSKARASLALTVVLPSEHFPAPPGAPPQPPHRSPARFELTVHAGETLDALMRRAFAAHASAMSAGIGSGSGFGANSGSARPPVVDPLAEPADGSLAARLVAKVAGFNDYLVPSKVVFEYEAVRDAIRNAASLTLLLVERPAPLVPGCDESLVPSSVWQDIADARGRFNHLASEGAEPSPLDRHAFTDTLRSFHARLATTPMHQAGHGGGIQHIPLAALADVPFRVRVLGLERVNRQTLPRLSLASLGGPTPFAATDPTAPAVELFVRVLLVHGLTRLTHGPSSQTQAVRWDSSAPRFATMSTTAWSHQPWITPPPASLHATHLPYARLPRETRIIFLVYAAPASSTGATPAGGAGGAGIGGSEDDARSKASRGGARHARTTSAAQALVEKAAKAPTATDAIGGGDSAKSGKNDVLVGWSSAQLVDEYGHLLTGRRELNLWTFSCGLQDRTTNLGAASEDLAQILRGTNKNNPMPIPPSTTPGIVTVSSSATAAPLQATTSASLAHHKKAKSSVSGHGGHGSSLPAAPVAGVTPFASLTVEFDSFALPVVSPLEPPRTAPPAHGRTRKTLALGMQPKMLDKMDRRQFGALLRSDPLYTLTSGDRELLWLTRSHLVYHAHMLPKFLACVDWTNAPLAYEARRLLKVWSPPLDAVSALELLDAAYADSAVREYAVCVLDTRMTDAELQLYLLQLVQCLKFEPYHDSALARFLMRRALASPLQVGHHLFWHLKAEAAGSLDFQERFTLLLEEYLSHAGLHARELRKQHAVVQRLQKIAEMVVKMKVEKKASDAEATKVYHEQLNKLNRDFFARLDGGDGDGGKFQIPLNPKLEARRLLVPKCKFMSSKKVPLWLVFENADPNGAPIYLIFKSGDDLRQDILTLQLLRVMDQIWLEAGLDMRLKPYRCIATGVNAANEGVGMIEVVMGSDTTSGIQLKYGGGAIGALKLDPLDLFLRAHNPTPAAYERAVDNFIRSCAGYCVATFVLGIGDRHNGNIMVTQAGHLFHIDFGHFLGNFKKKFGFNRERSAFVFTPEMAYVMGGRNYKKSPLFKLFKECCFEGFNLLRKHAATLENLFLLMCSAGMPELMDRDDVGYLRDMLCLDYTDRQAEKRFKAEIQKSLDGTWRRIDNLIHNAVHA